MPAQISLDGFEAPASLTDRLFFALFPEANAADQIARVASGLRSQHGLKAQPLQTERFHVTLHHLGDYAGLRADIVSAAEEAASRVEAPPFDVTFDRAMTFAGRPNKRPFVLRGDEGLLSLCALQQQLGAALKKTILGRWAQGNFTPHVTLLYDDRLIAEQAIEPVSWTAREFVLVHSLIGQTRHIVLGRWPLNAAEA